MKCFVDEIEFWTFTCSDCGVMWAATVDYIKARQDDHKVFYCPNGCHRHYPQKTNEEKLREQLTNTKKRLAAEQECCIQAQEGWRGAERQVSAYKGVVTKMKQKEAP